MPALAPICAARLALVCFWLSARVIAGRIRIRVSLGGAGEPEMETGIHADRAAVVKAVPVTTFAQIDAKDLLVELE